MPYVSQHQAEAHPPPALAAGVKGGAALPPRAAPPKFFQLPALHIDTARRVFFLERKKQRTFLFLMLVSFTASRNAGAALCRRR
jgi:hypothetical protein